MEMFFSAACLVVKFLLCLLSFICATYCKSFMLYVCWTVVDWLFFSLESALLCSPCKYVKNGICLFNCLLIYYYLANASLSFGYDI